MTATALNLQDIFIRRDEDGAVIPITVAVPSLGGTIEVLPTTIGSVKGLTMLDKDCVQWPLNEKIRYVREHVVKPDLRALAANEIEEGMTMWDLDMILIAAVQAGGPQRRVAGKAEARSATSKT